MPGTLYIISAPSGAGKTSLVKALLARHKHLQVSISHTTRSPRPGEEDNVHYKFVSKEQFKELIDSNDLLEYAQVFDNYYGTSKSWVTQTLESNIDVILEIDWQGAQQVRKAFQQAVSIFILPPSRHALEERLVRRAQDDRETILKRLDQAKLEMEHYVEYDFIIVNDIFEKACSDLSSIIVSEKLKTKSQEERHSKMIQSLIGKLGQ